MCQRGGGGGGTRLQALRQARPGAAPAGDTRAARVSGGRGGRRRRRPGPPSQTPPRARTAGGQGSWKKRCVFVCVCVVGKEGRLQSTVRGDGVGWRAPGGAAHRCHRARGAAGGRHSGPARPRPRPPPRPASASPRPCARAHHFVVPVVVQHVEHPEPHEAANCLACGVLPRGRLVQREPRVGHRLAAAAAWVPGGGGVRRSGGAGVVGWGAGKSLAQERGPALAKRARWRAARVPLAAHARAGPRRTSHAPCLRAQLRAQEAPRRCAGARGAAPLLLRRCAPRARRLQRPAQQPAAARERHGHCLLRVRRRQACPQAQEDADRNKCRCLEASGGREDRGSET